MIIIIHMLTKRPAQLMVACRYEFVKCLDNFCSCERWLKKMLLTAKRAMTNQGLAILGIAARVEGEGVYPQAYFQMGLNGRQSRRQTRRSCISSNGVEHSSFLAALYVRPENKHALNRITSTVT